MKVSLSVREGSSRKYKKAKSATIYPEGTVYVLRYGHTWETLGDVPRHEASAKRAERQRLIHQGWTPTPKVKKPAHLMLDAAKDAYLKEIEDGRKKKTFQAYSVALRYFSERIGNKPVKDINRADMLSFATFLREEKKQSPRSPTTSLNR